MLIQTRVTQQGTRILWRRHPVSIESKNPPNGCCVAVIPEPLKRRGEVSRYYAARRSWGELGRLPLGHRSRTQTPQWITEIVDDCDASSTKSVGELLALSKLVYSLERLEPLTATAPTATRMNHTYRVW